MNRINTIGVDGCSAGWFACWRVNGGIGSACYASANDVVENHPDASVIAVDIPIGLTDEGPRSADQDARKFLRSPRASSVFPAPVRGVLGYPSQREASIAHQSIDGRGLSVFAFAILPKIREWDEVLQANYRLRERVREVHPEVCFAELAGGRGLVFPKKSKEGHAERLCLLEKAFDRYAIEHILTSTPRNTAKRDDVLDALVALWSAERIETGSAKSFPSPPEVDSKGLMMAIWY